MNYTVEHHHNKLLDDEMDRFDREQEYLEKLDDSIISDVNAMKDELYETICENLNTEQEERFRKNFYIEDIKLGRLYE